MRLRSMILGVLVVFGGGVAAGGWLLLRDPVNPLAASRLRAGMTEAKVQAVLGRPADREYHPWDIAVFMPPDPGTSPEWEKAWEGQEWVVLVHFDDAGRVIKAWCGDKDFDAGSPPPQTVSRRLWRLLGW